MEAIETLMTQTLLNETSASKSMQDIFIALERSCDQMKNHPLKKIFALENSPVSMTREFAGIQYVDSVLWVPMLAVMKDRSSNTKLHKALLDNLLCEAGANHQSHVVMCQEFVKSIGISPFFGNFNEYSSLPSHAVEMMNAVSGMNEGQIAGFNLVSEAIVPDLFRMALPAFQRIPGCNTRYLTEHISVDSDEHAAAMIEAVKDMVQQGTSVDSILEGMHLSARTALSIPDSLYAKYLRGAYGA